MAKLIHSCPWILGEGLRRGPRHTRAVRGTHREGLKGGEVRPSPNTDTHPWRPSERVPTYLVPTVATPVWHIYRYHTGF